MTSNKRCLIPREAIARRVAELGERISRDYTGRDLVLVGVLKGAFVFMADLVRALKIPVEVDFVRLYSYGASTHSSGEVRISKDVELFLRGRDVLIVEDIVDSGLTMVFLRQHLEGYEARSVKICCLIDKAERRQVEVRLDYVGFQVPKGFLVGYGLDCGEKGRGLPEIYELVKEE